MPLFQCAKCGCVDNTACSSQGFTMLLGYYDWTGLEEFRGKTLCNVCGPRKYISGGSTKSSDEWHKNFPRVFLPLNMFETNSDGNLTHKENGDTDYRAYALRVEETPKIKPLIGT